MDYKSVRLQFLILLLFLTNSINTSDKCTFGCVDRLRSLLKQNKAKTVHIDTVRVESSKTAELGPHDDPYNSIVPGLFSPPSPHNNPHKRLSSRLLNPLQTPPMLSVDGYPKRQISQTTAQNLSLQSNRSPSRQITSPTEGSLALSSTADHF